MAKILVVDDQSANRSLVVTLIHHRGHQALEAVDGAQALALVRSERPDLVISDILMPTMDGFEFVHQLRMDPLIAGTEVMFYTAHYRGREARSLAESCGVSRVLVKPCEPEDILNAIDHALAHAPDSIPPPEPQEFDREHLRLMTDKLSEQLDQLQGSNQRLAALTDLNLHLASERDPGTLLEKFCRGARDLVGARYAVLGVHGQAPDAAVLFTSGLDAAVAQRFVQPRLDRGMLGQVLADGRSRRLSVADGNAEAVGLPAGCPDLYACLAAPVVSPSRSYGWICLCNKLGASEFNAEDEQILTILAAQVGRVYETGNLYAEVRQHAGALRVEMVERRRAADELRASEAGLRRAQVMAQLSHAITAPDGTFERWSDTLPYLLGVEPKHVVRSVREWMALVHPQDRALFRDQAIAAGAGGMRADFEYRLRHSSGSWLHVRQVMEPLLAPDDPSGRARWFNTIQDITGQKNVEVKLLETSRQLQTLSRRVLEAQETERRRVAVELHDELGQSLTAIKINLQTQARPGEPARDKHADNLRIVDDALQQVRRLALALRPSMLDDLGLAPALSWLADQTAARSGMRVRFESAVGAARLAPEIETACFRIAQEALTNIVRHAEASSVDVKLYRDGDALVLHLHDDGRGFDPAAMRKRAIAGGSIGVLGMQERATLVGGQLDIDSSPGQGTTLRMHCPWRTQEQTP